MSRSNVFVALGLCHGGRNVCDHAWRSSLFSVSFVARTLCLAPWPCWLHTPCFLLPCWCVLVNNGLTSYILLSHRRCVCWMDYRELLCEESRLSRLSLVRTIGLRLVDNVLKSTGSQRHANTFLSLVTNSLQRAYHIPLLSSMIPNRVLYSSIPQSSRLLVREKRVVSSTWNFGSLGIHVLGWCQCMTQSLNVTMSTPPIAINGPKRVSSISELPQSSISLGLLSALTAAWTMGGQSGEACSSSAVVR